MSLSISEVKTRIDYMRKLDQTGFDQLSDNDRSLLTLIEALNMHNFLITKALLEISGKFPGSITIKTVAELSQTLMKG